MANTIRWLSPTSSSGSFAASVLVHFLLFGSVIYIVHYHTSAPPAYEDVMDLGYQTFDEPPAPAQEERRVVRAKEPVMPVEKTVKTDSSAKELQDDKGEVAGTQKATVENNVGSDSSGTAATTPYYRIKPKYPRAALQAGIEGWVMVNIDITETGDVENVRVIDGEQRNLFQSEARRAVSQWKYRPFLDQSGNPFRKVDHQVRVDFKLHDVNPGSESSGI